MTSKTGRPLRRRITKLLARLLLGGSRAHYHSWLPSLSIVGREAGAPGTVRFRGAHEISLRSSDMLAERAGDRIVIIGSGPSVNSVELARLPSKSSILLNGAIGLVGEKIAMPLAIAIEDERFIWRHFDMIRDRLAIDVPCLFSPGVLRALYEIDKGWLTGRQVVLIDDIRKPYGAPCRRDADLRQLDFVTLSADGKAGFSTAPDRGVFQGGSVVISALQFALASPARHIGLVGIDISNADAPRFYEKKGSMAFSGIAGAEARILAHIALAKEVAERNGVELVNHSAVSALRSIGLEYVSFD
ncbi:glycosyl transferase [Rhizobium sp. KVB221]|uniref:Glycosyl transferase n=1 Tax=Rhizobium setariae TaxID=2801340 RepID=A0A937CNF4_9HYPH|nr:glycosyl transferase [Rhizobium setariae]MBL0371934.1 glycosyl transferase [Rhizobium setariae]